MKDRVELICDIGELAGLFEKSNRLEDFLQSVVQTVAYHMNAAVCSVYLFDEASKTLILRATQGLAHDSVGKVRLNLQQGITGKALRELRPICEGRASKSPDFFAIPGIDEEHYESFLAVPIVRGLTRVGVLVIQDTQKSYFNANDSRALQAIAAQLATCIENAELFISLHELGDGKTGQAASQRPADLTPLLKGTPVSSGIARGHLIFVGGPKSDLHSVIVPEKSHVSPEEFEAAIQTTEDQLIELQRQTEESLGDVASMIFSAHLLMLRDGEFTGAMMEKVRKGTNTCEAVIQVVEDYSRVFASSKNERLREKVQDLEDLGRRLIHNICGREDDPTDYEQSIVVSGSLLPSDIVKLSAQHVAGMILLGSSPTAHVSILARSLQIPTVLFPSEELEEGEGVKDGVAAILDAEQGNLYLNPDAQVHAQYEALEDSRKRAQLATEVFEGECNTCDGERIHVLANVNMLSELSLVSRYEAEGIGLYRSEFPFLVRTAFPSEEEQYLIYLKLLQQAPQHHVVFRVLDVGGDKALSYFPTSGSLNPSLGLRAIRFLLEHREVFICQLRALLRAGAEFDLKIMFPMISSLDELMQAREVVQLCMHQLDEEGVAHNSQPALGVMVELPSAVEVIEELAEHADFACVGTNDLVQYILGVDRTDPEVASHYIPYHPAVLRSLQRIASACIRFGKGVSLCGEMASDPVLLPFLMGIGIRSFSVDARSVMAVKRLASSLSMAEARERADLLLGLGRISEIEAELRG